MSLVLLWTLSGTTLASNAIDDILQSGLVDDALKEYLLRNTLKKDETIDVLVGIEIDNDEPSFTDTTEEYEL